LKLNSQPTGVVSRRRPWLLGACAVMAMPASAFGQNNEPQSTIVIGSGPVSVAETDQRLNTTGRAVDLTTPIKDGSTYLGDIVITIDPNDRITFSAQRFADVVSRVLDARILEAVNAVGSGKTSLSPEDLEGTGISVTYNPQTLELALEIPPEYRATRTIQVSALDRPHIGDFDAPAVFSAYVNMRGAIDYVQTGSEEGWADPVFFLDTAARYGGVVFEAEGIAQPGVEDAEFQRLGTRFVIDDAENVLRWTFGDLRPVGRGLQSVPEIAGISIYRAYSVLQPQLIARPRGARTFELERPSTVEISVNGQSTRRLRLDPGVYNLQDFPFTLGGNDIRVDVLDDAGRTETLRFNLFFDQTQLAAGLSEFGVFAGVKAPLGPDEPEYSDDWQFTGFYRRGMNDFWTVGGNLQADEMAHMAGVESLFATSIGTFSIGLAQSDIDGVGSGHAGTFTYQRLLQRSNGYADSISFFAESRSEQFAPIGVTAPDNRFEYEVGATYSRVFSDHLYGGFDVRYSRGRDVNDDAESYRTTLGWRLNHTFSTRFDLIYENPETDGNFVGLFSLTARLGGYSSARVDYDSRGDRVRASYQAIGGQGVGSYNVAANVEHTSSDSGANLSANYYGNRAEIGVSHFGVFEEDFGSATNERSSLRVGTSFAVADGVFSFGRPIYDSFAIVRPHRNLKDTEILVEPVFEGYSASTGVLGVATQANLSSYNERTITIEAPEAPQGADVGRGSFRLFPPYRSGYNLVVGTDYSVTAIGKMLDEEGAPLSLIAGRAFEVAHPERDPVTMFTNREGRFGATGLAPGRWRIEMNTEPTTIYFIDVPADAVGVFRTNDLTPSGDQ
jgi:outer membrane usher protein